MANCGCPNFLLENAGLKLLYGYQKATAARSCVDSSIIFPFESRHFGGRENVSDLKCNKEICLLLSLLKISAMETPVTFCRTQAAMLLRYYIPCSSPLNLFSESLFLHPQCVFYEKPLKNVAACDVMEGVNGKASFIFISKTSAG